MLQAKRRIVHLHIKMLIGDIFVLLQQKIILKNEVNLNPCPICASKDALLGIV